MHPFSSSSETRFPVFPTLRQLCIEALHADGCTDHHMAALLGVSVRTIANERRVLGLPVNRKKAGQFL